jgi:hypothetical protein
MEPNWKPKPTPKMDPDRSLEVTWENAGNLESHSPWRISMLARLSGRGLDWCPGPIGDGREAIHHAGAKADLSGPSSKQLPTISSFDFTQAHFPPDLAKSSSLTRREEFHSL